MADLAHRKSRVPRRRRPWMLGLMLLLLAVVVLSGGALLHAEQTSTPAATQAQPAASTTPTTAAATSAPATGSTAATPAAGAAATTAAGATATPAAGGEATPAAPKRTLEQDIDIFNVDAVLDPPYATVLEQWRKEGYKETTGVSITIDPTRFVRKYATSVGSELRTKVVSNYAGRPGKTLLWLDEETVLEWEVNIPKSGLYNISFVYYPLEGKRASIQRDLKIDGKYPFNEANRLLFERTWKDAYLPKQDNQGNDIRPRQIDKNVWQEKKFTDPTGMYRSPFLFYLSAGKHRLTMNAMREPMALAAIKITSPEVLPTYEQVAQMYKAKGYRNGQSELLRFQTEFPELKSTPTIRSEYSNDPSALPEAKGYQRLNVFGGSRWRQGDQWAEWKFSVPEDGLYKLGFKVWQGGSDRLPSARKIMIDGKVPFYEAEEFYFPYSRDHYIQQFGDDKGNPYLIYLTKGEHTLRMTAEVGAMARTIRMLKQASQEMMLLNRAIVLITGPTPDPNFDWEIDEKIPELIPRLSKLEKMFADEVKWIRQHAPNSRYADSFDMTRSILASMVKNPDSITNRLAEFSTQESMMSSSVLSLQYSPLEIDYFVVAPPDTKFPNVRPTAWQRFVSGFRSFLLSFVKNSTGIGDIYKTKNGVSESGEKVLELWVGHNREWASIIKEMIEEDFTPATGIKVNVNVIPAGALDPNSPSVLLLSAAAGKAPDITFGSRTDLPVEFAIRGGALNLNTFPDYKEVAKRFRPGALIPYKYKGGDYALPETQSFQMLFYRKDILNQYKLKPPQTWDDVIDMLPTLQQYGMNFYYNGGFTPFLFQHGGDYYFGDGQYSALDTPEALAAFKQWTDLYANYRIPVEASFYNRIRTGEMPIGVADYNLYIQLSTAAPELTGWWEMKPIPGTRKPDGTIDRTASGGATTVVIFSDTQYPKEAWELAKWWTSAPIQSRFGQELEAVIGVEARWNTANIEALLDSPWPKADIQAVEEQWSWLREQPIVLGGYFTGRHQTNAWNRVVLEGMNPREALEIAVKDIDRELAKKNEEFGNKVIPRKEYYAKYGGPGQQKSGTQTKPGK